MSTRIAATVRIMSIHTPSAPTRRPNSPLATTPLGDVLVLPDGRALTVRAALGLTAPVAGVAALIMAGELQVLLSIPSDGSSLATLMVPLDYLPAAVSSSRELAHGEVAYLPPHAAHVPGATGALLWRMLRTPGQTDPIILVYRGEEVVPFVAGALINSDACKLVPLNRPIPNTQTPVPTRTAARVVSDPSQIPIAPPRPARGLVLNPVG